MSNRRLLDRRLTPEWMNIALRIARSSQPRTEARHLLDVALRDEIEAPTARRKTATILAGSWLNPAPEAECVVDWGKRHAGGDLRIWHLGVLLANYTFFDDVCTAIGRAIRLGHEITTVNLRSAMKGRWGDREVVDTATRAALRPLRSFGVLVGDRGATVSVPGELLGVDPEAYPWLVHALLVGRGVEEAELRDVQRAPELFMFELPDLLPNGYPHLERFREGGGREVVGVVERRPNPTPSIRQLELEA